MHGFRYDCYHEPDSVSTGEWAWVICLLEKDVAKSESLK